MVKKIYDLLSHYVVNDIPSFNHIVWNKMCGIDVETHVNQFIELRMKKGIRYKI